MAFEHYMKILMLVTINKALLEDGTLTHFHIVDGTFTLPWKIEWLRRP